MPIYEYRCTACQHKLETLQRFSDAPLVTCPACGKEALTKLVSAAGFQLKGSGWYQTDFRGGGGAKKAETAEKAEGGSEKPAAATDAPAKTETSTTKAESAPAASPPSSTPSST